MKNETKREQKINEFLHRGARRHHLWVPLAQTVRNRVCVCVHHQCCLFKLFDYVIFNSISSINLLVFSLSSLRPQHLRLTCSAMPYHNRCSTATANPVTNVERSFYSFMKWKQSEKWIVKRLARADRLSSTDHFTVFARVCPVSIHINEKVERKKRKQTYAEGRRKSKQKKNKHRSIDSNAHDARESNNENIAFR